MPASRPRLVLGVKSRSWRKDYEATDRAFQDIRPRVLDRDRHTCRFCGFHALKWQHVHHLDDDHANNEMSNLVTICAYCHMNFHLGKAGQDGATLAFVPELPAEAISHLWRAIAVAMVYPSFLKARAERGRPPGSVQLQEAMALFDAARATLDFLGERTKRLETLLGTSSPVLLGEALLAASRAEPEFFERREEWLHGVRLLPPGPDRDFGGREMYQFFLSPEGPFGDSMSPATWSAVMRSLDGARSARSS
jgi:intracellular multiplication protein IcmJ